MLQQILLSSTTKLRHRTDHRSKNDARSARSHYHHHHYCHRCIFLTPTITEMPRRRRSLLEETIYPRYFLRLLPSSGCFIFILISQIPLLSAQRRLMAEAKEDTTTPSPLAFVSSSAASQQYWRTSPAQPHEMPMPPPPWP